MNVDVLQRALAAAGLPAWLFYGFGRANPLALEVLGLEAVLLFAQSPAWANGDAPPSYPPHPDRYSDYADALVQSASRVEVAALDTRPFSQPLTAAPVAEEAPGPRPATSAVTATATAQPADPGVVPATSSGSLHAALRDAVKTERPPVLRQPERQLSRQSRQPSRSERRMRLRLRDRLPESSPDRPTRSGSGGRCEFRA
jgi:hypothetical protein